jgi:hypothetical protein
LPLNHALTHSLRSEPLDLLSAHADILAARGRAQRIYPIGARWFLARWPDPTAWAGEALETRLAVPIWVRPFVMFLMLHGHLRPGYDYLLERRLGSILRDAAMSPLWPQLQGFLQAGAELGYGEHARLAAASQVVARLLIETGRSIERLTEHDFAAFEAAVTELEKRRPRSVKHYRVSLVVARTMIYHRGGPAEPLPKRSTLLRWSWERHLDGVQPGIRRALVAYLECCVGTHVRTTVAQMAGRLAHFGRFLGNRWRLWLWNLRT